MAYDRKFKEEVLDAVANGMSAPEAALKYNVSEQAIRNWRSEDPEQYGNDKRKPIRTYDLKEKLDLIKQAENGKSTRDIALETGLSMSTIRHWISDKNHIYAVYYAWDKASKETRDSPEKEKQDMDPEDRKRDEHLENKTLKEENEYLKAKVLYLEKLMELSGTPAPDFKKKQDTKLSEISPKAKE